MQPTLILVAVCGTVFGALLGFLVSKKFSSSSKKQQDLEHHLHQAQQELKNYQLEVTQHFSETAQLLKKMAESYRDVHNHLATGANTLSKDDHQLPIMKKLPEIDTINALSDEPVQITAPLDYAPKNSPYDKGTLNSDSHLEKVNLNENSEQIADALAKQSKL